MTEQVRQEFIRTFHGIDFVDLSAADRGVQYLDQNLANTKRFGKVDFIHDQRLARLGEDSASAVFTCIDLYPSLKIDELVITAIAEVIV